MSKTRNRLASVVRARAVWMVLDQEGEHASRSAAVSSIAGKIGCTAELEADLRVEATFDEAVEALTKPITVQRVIRPAQDD